MLGPGQEEGPVKVCVPKNDDFGHYVTSNSDDRWIRQHDCQRDDPN